MALGILEGLSAAIGIGSLFKRNKNPPGYDQMAQAAEKNNAIVEALLNPDTNATFQGLARGEEEKIRSDFADALRQLRSTNTRARARGGGFLNPERTDSSLAMAAARFLPTARDQARANARSYLMSALQGNNATLGGYGQVAQIGGAINQQNQQNRLGGIEALLTGAKGLLNGDPNQSGYAQPKITVNVGGYNSPFGQSPSNAASGFPWKS